jgi:hypothetical protein
MFNTLEPRISYNCVFASFAEEIYKVFALNKTVKPIGNKLEIIGEAPPRLLEDMPLEDEDGAMEDDDGVLEDEDDMPLEDEDGVMEDEDGALEDDDGDSQPLAIVMSLGGGLSAIAPPLVVKQATLAIIKFLLAPEFTLSSKAHCILVIFVKSIGTAFKFPVVPPQPAPVQERASFSVVKLMVFLVHALCAGVTSKPHLLSSASAGVAQRLFGNSSKNQWGSPL